MTASAFRFGPHALDPHTRTLETGGRPVALGARAYDVLLALVERSDRVVSKAELLDAAWPGMVVEENNLQVQISTLRKLLGSKAIATIPGRGYQFTLPLEAQHRQTRAQPDADAVHGLFGRDQDLRTLAGRLADGSAITIAGPGGVGKTVLARALLAMESEREAVWVELAAVRDPALVLATVAAALGVRVPAGDPTPALAAAIAARKLLVAIDNAEHLADATGKLVADLRARAPAVRFLVTSQVPLAIHGEDVYRLEPLPDAAAVELFVARATAADRRFALSADNAEAVAAICRQLDGMPLALELAAARVRELGVDTLRASLAERLRMLATKARTTTPERQRSLRAALEWSHALLDDGERAMFRRVGVFSGGFTLPLALALGGHGQGDWAAVDNVAALAERSLVSVSGEEPPRYSLPETMRAFALEELDAAGETHAVRERHARAVLAYFASVRSENSASPQYALAQRELDNARDAFFWAREHDWALAIELATLVARFTVYSARRGETLSWLASCEPLLSDAIPPAIRASWWLEFARYRLFNRHPQAKDAARRALALNRQLGDDYGVVQALAALVRSHYQHSDETRAALAEIDALASKHAEWTAAVRHVLAGTHAHAATIEDPIDYAAATRYRKEEASYAAAMGSVVARNTAETNLIALLRAQDRHDEVRERANALLARLRGARETANLAYAALHLLDALLATHRLGEARSCAAEAWQACRAMNLPIAADPVALLAALEGRARTAARLLGYARALYARMSFTMPDVTLTYLAQVEAIVRGKLDGAECDALLAEGAQWSEEDAQRAAFERIDDAA